MLPYKTTVFCVASCDFIKSPCWAICSSTNRENHACRTLKSCVSWHLAAGCSTSVIMIQQPLYLTHWQLNLWPNVTDCRSHDCYIAKQGANVTGAPAAQRTIPAKVCSELCEGWAELFLWAGISRQCQPLTEEQKIKPWWDMLHRSQVALLTLQSYRGENFQRTRRTATLSSLGDVTKLFRGQPLY